MPRLIPERIRAARRHEMPPEIGATPGVTPAPGGPRKIRRAQAPHQRRRELQVGLDEGDVAHRLEVVDARYRQHRAHQAGRHPAALAAPVAAQHHRGQVTTGRVTGYHDARRVTAELRDVAPGPQQRLHHLQRDRVDTHRRAQRVVREHHRSPGVDEGGCHEGQVSLVQRAPPAAVDEDQHGGSGLARGEDIERFCCARAVGKV